MTLNQKTPLKMMSPPSLVKATAGNNLSALLANLVHDLESVIDKVIHPTQFLSTHCAQQLENLLLFMIRFICI